MLLFKREFKRNLKGLIIWTAVIGGLILLILAIYPQFAKDQEKLNAMLQAYPESMTKAFGMDKLSFGTVLGFYAVEGYLMITLFGSIYAVMLASNILSKEANEKTIEFLLSKPISRVQIITQKLLAIVTNLVILNVVVAIVNLIGFNLSKNNQVETKTFLLISIAPFILQLTFSAVSFLISCIVKKSRSIFSISLSIVFVTYFFSIISGISDKYKKLKYISPFKYVDAADVITTKEIRPLYVIIMAAVILISIAASYVLYEKKDITV